MHMYDDRMKSFVSLKKENRAYDFVYKEEPAGGRIVIYAGMVGLIGTYLLVYIKDLHSVIIRTHEIAWAIHTVSLSVPCVEKGCREIKRKQSEGKKTNLKKQR